jgi:hypothetical protein
LTLVDLPGLTKVISITGVCRRKVTDHNAFRFLSGTSQAISRSRHETSSLSTSRNQIVLYLPYRRQMSIL